MANCKHNFKSLHFLTILALVLTLVLGLSVPKLSFALDTGKAAPDFSLPSNSKGDISLKKLKGKVVYLDVWASWCSVCVHTLPWMNDLRKKFPKNKFEILAVNVDENRADADKLLKSTGSDLLVAYDQDGKIPELYGVEAMPSSFLLDKTGKIVKIFKGFHEEEKGHVEALIKKLVK